MAVNPWFKFYGAEYLADPKIDQLTPLERSCWITLLCLANVSGDEGVVHNLKIFTLLTKAGIYPLDSAGEQMGLKDDYNDTLGVLEHFESLGMIQRIDAFSYRVKNWTKRQETALTNAERQAKYRENKKSNENVTARVTKVTLEENRKEEIRISPSVATAPRLEITEEEENPKPKKVSQAKYPHSKEVFAVFVETYEPEWERNTTQLRAAEAIYTKATKEDSFSDFVDCYKRHKNCEFCPSTDSPYEMNMKWPKLDRHLTECEL